MTIREERVFHTLFLCMMHGISIPYTVISSAARNLFRPLFPSSFAKPFTGSTAPHLFAIRCFPFLAAKHSPSYRQRKRSLGFARDDVAEAAFSQHILYTGHGLSIFPPTVISSAARNLPCTLLFLAPFAKGFPFSALSCSLRRSIPVFCYHTYGAILVCKKDRGLRSG